MDFSGVIAILIIFGPVVMFFYIRQKYKEENKKLRERNAFLEPFSKVADASEEAERIIEHANEKLYQADIKDKEAQKYFSSVISEAKEQAAEIIRKAEAEAKEIRNSANKTIKKTKIDIAKNTAGDEPVVADKKLREGRKVRREKGKSIIDFPEEFCMIDLETTGLSPAKDRIIEIGAIKYSHEKVVDSFQSLINPGVKISGMITRITGITNEMLETAPLIGDVLPSFHEFLGESLIVGHNVNFDINFLYDNYVSYLGFPLRNDFVDLLRIARMLCPDLPHHRLQDLIEHFNIEVKTSHRALSDCETAFTCYQNFKNASRK